MLPTSTKDDQLSVAVWCIYDDATLDGRYDTSMNATVKALLDAKADVQCARFGLLYYAPDDVKPLFKDLISLLVEYGAQPPPKIDNCCVVDDDELSESSE